MSNLVISDRRLKPIAAKVLAGERLSQEDGVALYRSPDLLAVGWLANHVREKRHGNVTYLNRVAEKIIGWSREEALGRGPRRERGSISAPICDQTSNAGRRPNRRNPKGETVADPLAALRTPHRSMKDMFVVCALPSDVQQFRSVRSYF